MKENNYTKIPNLFKSRSQRIITPLKFILNPAKLFNKAVVLNMEIFKISMGPEDWTFLSGNDGLQYFGKLTMEDVDTFEFRAKMYTLDLPKADAPENLGNISRTTNKVVNEFFATLSPDDISTFFLDQISRYMEVHIPNSGIIENLHSFHIKLSYTIFSNLFFGEEVMSKLPKDIGEQYVAIGESLYILPLVIPAFKPHNKKTIDAKNKLVDGYQTMLDIVKDPNSKIKPAPVLQGYLELQKQYGISDKNLIWLLNAFLWASIHYTSVHGLWIGTEIIKNSEFFANILNELHDEKTLTVEQLNNNEYLENMILENIRLHSVFALPRRLKRDLIYKDYFLAKGSVLAASPYVEHHKGENYAHPQTFDPHRWAHKASRDHFVPGGLGFFGCIGMSLAISCLKAIWAVLLKNYELEILGPIPVLKERLILLPPKKPIQLKYSKKG